MTNSNHLSLSKQTVRRLYFDKQHTGHDRRIYAQGVKEALEWILNDRLISTQDIEYAIGQCYDIIHGYHTWE